ncbi:MAG: bacillithiol system redox-active protein YtxJ [Bacteroidota bacterium]|nr:bacillithiol system redox-active protein YtxJ [Bacteroidota bacterium]
MGFFTSKNKNSSNEPASLNWKPLQSVLELDTLSKNSHQKPVLIFKHSTRCSISRMVLKQFENDYTIDPTKMDSYFVDLLNFRSVSNEIANKFLVEHQSPQILLIKNGKCIYYASHSDIDAEAVESILRKN